MAKGTPTSAKTLLILLATALVIVIVATVFLTVDRPEDNGGTEVAEPAPEQQVESEDTGAPVTPHRPSPPLEEPPVDQDDPANRDDSGVE